MIKKSFKRKLLVIGAISALGMATPVIAQTSIVHAEEVATVYESTVKISGIKNGDVIADIEEGHVGDKVTLKVSPYVLFKTESVTVNGTALVANEDGNYEFLLVEGENKVDATFAVNHEQLTELAQVMASVKDEGWESLFSLDNVLMLGYFALSILLSSGFFITLLKSKKIEAKTANQISDAVNLVTESSAKQVFSEFLEKTLGPTFEKYSKKFDTLEDVSKTLARCFVLSQEDTPEARLAIIEELTKLQSGTKEVSEEVKKIINEQIAKNEADKAELNAKIEELKAENKAVIKSEEKEEDTYGQI